MTQIENEEFSAQLEELGIPSPIALWLHRQMLQWHAAPRIDQPITIDPDEYYGFLVQGTAELCKYRPSFDDINAAISQISLQKFVDFGRVLARLAEDGPDVGSEVSLLCLSNQAISTIKLWQTLCQLPHENYNDQFAIHCFLDASLLEQVCSPSSFAQRLRNFLGKHFLWLNDYGIERDLKQRGYSYNRVADLKNCEVKVGDVLKVVKNAPEDSFVAFALVSETLDDKIKYLDFKLLFNSPMQASFDGFSLFFLRDPKVEIAGIWQFAKSIK